jgi:single-stranded-DNA-specific exonuclease
MNTMKICTRIVGVSFNGRQEIVSKLKVGEEIFLVRDPKNRFDRFAIAAERSNGQQFGFLNRELAFTLAPKLDQCGDRVKAIVAALTGGYYTGSNKGVLITFELQA